ncbi:glycosyltransferase [Agromyces sp. NPDC052230]
MGRLRRYIAEHSVRLIHAHFGTGAVNALGVAGPLGIPLLVTFHGFDVTRMPAAKRGKRYVQRLQSVFSYASVLIAVSDFIRDELIALGAPPEKIRVLHIGTPIEGSSGIRSTPDPAEPQIIFVGRLVEKKGVRDLLEAVALMSTDLRRTPIAIVGYGPAEPDLKRRSAELELNVRFLGRRSSAQIAALLRESTVFVGPSRRASDGDSEGFGMVFLEAALAGLPVIAYRHGGVVEAVEDGQTGLLAPEGDIPRLSALIERVLRDPDLADTLGRHGRDRVERQFDVRTLTAELEDIYSELATASRGR